ncbi:RDD family protein [Hyalangium rubrum]|uniref:RDD family protein n=1 Tax=Hyalangium rubrum TaxID=3103134 RepID=A0ABU5HAW9_9BACT|nr:RDD family protein [Hyalangium sp. s54d21]MDY7230257.1 RDD family protein [Hyalangium sp. s54d21]
MSEGALFGSEFSPMHTRYRLRLWAADLVDLGTAGLLGWGAARALNVEQSRVSLIAVLVGAWVVLSLVGGVRGWTLGRRLFDVRLVSQEGHAPGLPRALLRAFTALPDVLMAPLLPSRPLDRLLRVHGERTGDTIRARLRGLAVQLPWVAALALAAWFIATPTRFEAFHFLDTKLTGWKCCHGYRTHKDTWMCRRSLSLLESEARGEDPQAQALVTECPEVSARLAR